MDKSNKSLSPDRAQMDDPTAVTEGTIGSHIDTVISLEEELKMLQDENMSPRDIYLEHCLQFAKSNFDFLELTIDDYKIKRQDIEDQIFFKESDHQGDRDEDEQEIFGQENDEMDNLERQKTMALNKLSLALKDQVEDKKYFVDDYDILDIKIFPEVLLVKGKQQLIVKTWELIEKRKSNQKQTQLTKNHPFHVKTIRIYDSHNIERAQILTEQVDTNISSKVFYDTSTLQYDDCIFYFKRIYGTLEESSIESRNKGSLSSGGQSIDNEDEQSETFSNSYLQLFKYDLANFTEQMIEGYQLVEYNDDDRTFNIIFSQNFDNDDQLKKTTYKDEDEFLTDQYFLAQQYIKDEEEMSFALFCMNNFDEPIHHESPELQQDETSTTKQILYFFHRDIMIEQNHKILFVMISQQQHMHLIHDLSECMSEQMKIFKLEKNFDRMQNPKLAIHQVQLNYTSQENKWQNVDQQYFIDQRNQVHLMFPNYFEKSTKYKHIDLIKQQTGIRTYDNRSFKKILSIDYTQYHHNQVKRTPFVQRIANLKKILNFDDINSDQVFTFCKDPLDQVLYITQPDVNQIFMILMRDHHCEECFDMDVKEMKQSIYSMVNENILEIFKNFGEGAEVMNKRSKKSMTRMKKMNNHCEGRYHNFNIEELCKGEIDQDTIEIDIDSQRIMVTRNNDGGNDKYKCDDQPDTSKMPVKNPLAKVQLEQGCYHFMIEDYKGKKHKILLIESQLIHIEFLQIEIIQQTKDFYIFIFSALNYIEGEKRKTYMFIRQPANYVNNLIIDTSHGVMKPDYQFKPMLREDDLVQIVAPDNQLLTLEFKRINQYQLDYEKSSISISFEKLVDINTKLNFVTCIYQEAYNTRRNKMLIYDIDQMAFTQKIEINPNQSNMKYLYMDDQGFNCFKIMRSAEMIDHTDKVKRNFNITGKGKNQALQEQKFQVFTLYIETLGRIQIQEFLIKQMTNTNAQGSNYQFQLVGQKQIFLSNKCIKNTNWNYLKQSTIIPFLDDELVQQGCQCILQHDKERQTFLNLIDQSLNNLYSYQSSIIKLGSKRFELNKDDYEDFLIVVAAKINDEVVDMNILDQQESFKILRTMQEILLAMRKPDLEYVVLNSFQSLCKRDFFTPQEILFGKSLCDICLSNPGLIKDGLDILLKEQDQVDEDEHIQKSIVFELTRGDKSRQKSFKDVDFFPQKMMVNFDFNFNTTIYRGLKMKSMQSIKFLLDYLFDEVNNRNYYKLIMLDLHELMSSKINSHFLYFFEESSEERKSVDRSQFCNLEIPYFDIEIEQFSEFQQQFLPIKQFTNIHDMEDEIRELILDRMAKQKQEREKQLSKGKTLKDVEYPIEHSYVDLNWLVIGEKMRSIADVKQLRKKRFDHLFYANMILQQYDEMQVFAQKTIQKLIDFQFSVSRPFMIFQFWFFTLLYVLPYSLTLVSEDHHTQLILLRFCIFPQIVLMSIKLIQLRVQGCNFFTGWNIIDVLQIICFQILLQILIEEEATATIYKGDPFVKIWLIMLTFLKFVHLIIVYENFGFFIKMVTMSLYDLRPFIISYIFFANFFVILYAVMEVEIDDELLTPGSRYSLGYYGLMFLAVWRNSVGKLGLPNVEPIVEKDNGQNSLVFNMNIYIIYVIYFIQIMFMLVIGLNFMIAIIESTFSEVNDDKLSYLYRNKAEMNLESFEILQYFSCTNTTQEYRAIIFTTYMDDQDDNQIVVHGRDEEIGFLLQNVEKLMEKGFQIIKGQKNYNDYLDEVIKNQTRIEKRITTEFDGFMKNVEEFRTTVMKKLAVLARPRRFTTYN